MRESSQPQPKAGAAEADRERLLGAILQRVAELNQQMQRQPSVPEAHPPPMSVAACAGGARGSDAPPSGFRIQPIAPETNAPDEMLVALMSIAAVDAPVAPQDRLPARSSSWCAADLLMNWGVLPRLACGVEDHLRDLWGDEPPTSLGAELDLLHRVLRDAWRCAPPLPPPDCRSVHVLVGPPGAGKTTCLCKWLAQLVLNQEHTATVWRLDGDVANTATALSVYGEVLGLPVHRSWQGSTIPDTDYLFVDLPGVDWRDADAMQRLRQRLQTFGPTQVHWVAHAGYDAALWLDQAHAFATVQPRDILVTHLDEERRWGKLWNLVLGAEYPIRFLSTGQNVPEGFTLATLDHLPGLDTDSNARTCSEESELQRAGKTSASWPVIGSLL